MKSISRRNFLQGSAAAGLAFGMPGISIGAGPRTIGPNDTVNIGVIGLGSTTAIGGVGGRGHQLIGRLRDIPGARIAALCDADQSHLDRELADAAKNKEKPKAYRDPREVFDDKEIDAVIVALPNHWHALATVWGCQAGKDVYCEKPFSHDLWEGRQMVAAARKYDRMVQVGTQSRSSRFLKRAFDRIRAGELGPVKFAHTLIYRQRDPIGLVDRPVPPPSTLNYDLWCGPIANKPPMRKQTHYEWHWFWETGNGEMGNNGIHVLDMCRFALGYERTPPKAMSIGGRFKFHDSGETANTHIAMFDFEPAPIICEIRNVGDAKKPATVGKYRGQNKGILIDCEGGYFAGDGTGGAFYDRDGKKMGTDLGKPDTPKDLEIWHLTAFLNGVRSRKAADLAAEAIQGHRSTSCCHLANISHRLGKPATPEAIRASVSGNGEMADAFNRLAGHLADNGVKLDETPATLGPWVTLDPDSGQFVGDHADAANALSRREYRKPFEVPDLTKA